MSFVILSPTSVTSTNEVSVTPTPDVLDCIAIQVMNDTTYALNVVLPAGKQSYMPPQTAQFFRGEDWYGGYINIFPLDVMGNAFSGTNVPQKLTIIGYRHGEYVPPDGSSLNLSKTVFVGNTVTVTGVDTLINDTSADGSTIIEITKQSGTPSNFLVKNDGTVQIAEYVGGMLTKLFETLPGQTVAEKLGALARTVEVLGTLAVDQDLQVTGTSTFTGTAGFNAATGVSVASNAIVTGVATLGTLQVTGNAVITGTSTFTGDSTFNGAGNAVTVATNMVVSGVGTIGTLQVTGTSTFTGDSAFNGAGNGISVATNMVVTGTATMGTLSVTANATVAGSLSVTGRSLLDNGSIHSDGFGNLTTAQFFGSNINASGTLTVTGAATFSSTSTHSGLASFTASPTGVTVASNMVVTGTATLGILQVTGTSTFSGTSAFNAAGNGLTVASNMVVTGTATIGTLGVTGNATVTGSSTFTGQANFNATTGVNVASSMVVTGNAVLGTLNVTGNATVTGTSTFTGDSVFNGAGNAISVASSMVVTGVGTIGTLNVTGNATITGTSTYSGTANFNASGTGVAVASNMVVTGTGTIGTLAVTGNATITGSSTFTGQANFNAATGVSVASNMVVTGVATFAKTSADSLVASGAIAISGRTSTTNGNTSGTAELYQVIDGAGWKVTYIHLSSMNNSGAGNTDVALPVAYAEGAEFFVSNIVQIQAMAGGVAQTFQIVTALAAAGGTNTNQTTLNSYSWAHVGGTTIDTIRFSGSIAGAHSGAITIIGR